MMNDNLTETRNLITTRMASQKVFDITKLPISCPATIKRVNPEQQPVHLQCPETGEN